MLKCGIANWFRLSGECLQLFVQFAILLGVGSVCSSLCSLPFYWEWGVFAALCAVCRFTGSGECLQFFVQFTILLGVGSVCSSLCSLPIYWEWGVSAALCTVCHITGSGECLQLFVQFAVLLGPTQVFVTPSGTVKSWGLRRESPEPLGGQ